MKRLIFLISILFAMSANAQLTLVSSPNGNLQSFNAQLAYGYDSVHLAAAGTAMSVPSGYMDYTQLIVPASGAYTGAVTMPTSPVLGQTVTLLSTTAFYHTFTTSPSFLLKDSTGTKVAKFIWNGKYWLMVQ